MQVRDVPLMALSERQEDRSGGLEAADAPGAMPEAQRSGKWPADPILAEAMARMRTLVEEALARAGDDRAATCYEVLATQLENEVARVMLHSRLALGADAAWKAVLAELMRGIDALAGKGLSAKRRAGLQHVLRALERYEAWFEAPDRRHDRP